MYTRCLSHCTALHVDVRMQSEACLRSDGPGALPRPPLHSGVAQRLPGPGHDGQVAPLPAPSTGHPAQHRLHGQVSG